MIIKLIQPKMELRPMDTYLKSRMAPPLGLLVIAQILRHKHTVIIENENVETLDYSQRVDLVGLSVTVDTFDRACEIAKTYRSKGTPVIAGGIHMSSYPDLSGENFDSICVGPSELVWDEIMEDLASGRLKPLYKSRREMLSEDIVSPAYDLIDHRKYLYTNVIFTSYGCPFKCEFCYNSCDTYRDIHIRKPIKQVVDEIKALDRKHIMFIDDNFIGDVAWAREMIEALAPLKIKWNCAVSANIVHMTDLLDRMQQTGCQGLFIGFESLSQGAINKMNKSQNSIEKYETLVREIHRRGMMINASFVFGFDNEDKSVFRQTADWIIKNRIETITSHILTPYPGTALYTDFQVRNIIRDDNFGHYNTSYVVYEPQGMSSQELLDGYKWLYRELYKTKNILRRVPRSRAQILPFFMFNLFYRKFGRFTDYLCQKINYRRIGIVAEKVSKYI